MTSKRKRSSNSSLTSGPRRIDGARALFFERLTEIGGRKPIRVHDIRSLREAVRRSCEDLFSVRIPESALGRPADERTILDYGIPSLERYAPAREDDRAALAEEIELALTAFEPRLSDPRVSVEMNPRRHERLIATIEGELRIGKVVEAFSFQMPLSPTWNA